MLPAPGVHDRGAPQNSGCPVEVEEAAAEEARETLEHEVAVEEDGLSTGQERVVAVEVIPPPLHHPDPRVGEVVDRLLQEIGLRNKIGIENGDELALRRFQPVFQGTGLEARAILPVDIVNVQTDAAPSFHSVGRDHPGLVGRIVKHLDVEQMPRIIEGADGVDEALHHVHFVVGRELDGDPRQFVELRPRLRDVPPVTVEEKHHDVPVHPVKAQDCEDYEVRRHDRRVEAVHLIQVRDIPGSEELLVGRRWCSEQMHRSPHSAPEV